MKNFIATITNKAKENDEYYLFARQRFIDRYQKGEHFLSFFENYKKGNARLICHLLKFKEYEKMVSEDLVLFWADKVIRLCFLKKNNNKYDYFSEALQLIRCFDLESGRILLKEVISQHCIMGIRNNQTIRGIISFIKKNQIDFKEIISEVVNSLEFKEKKHEATEIIKFFQLEIVPEAKNERLEKLVNHRLCRMRY